MSYVVEAPFMLPIGPGTGGGPAAALIVRTPAIAGPYHELLVANRERLARWEPWAANPIVFDETKAHLAASATKWADGTEIPTAIVVRGADGWSLAGAVGLRINQYLGSADLGYWIDAAYEGQGIVTRAARTMLDQAFGSLGLARVELGTLVDNERSRAVARRLGFTEEGVQRQSVPIHGTRHDGVLYGLLAHEHHPTP